MNPIINLNVMVEKELELERQGYRRTRRYIGDAPALSDECWYEKNGNRPADAEARRGAGCQTEEAAPCQEEAPALLAWLFRRPKPRRQPPCRERWGETARCR